MGSNIRLDNIVLDLQSFRVRLTDIGHCIAFPKGRSEGFSAHACTGWVLQASKTDHGGKVYLPILPSVC